MLLLAAAGLVTFGGILRRHSKDVYKRQPLKRYIQKYVETLAAKMILADQVDEGDTIVITVEDDKLSAKCEKGSKNK